jgi:hypothetical protein
VADGHAHRPAAELQAESTAVAGVLAGSHRARLTSRHRGQVQRPTEDRGTGLPRWPSRRPVPGHRPAGSWRAGSARAGPGWVTVPASRSRGPPRLLPRWRRPHRRSRLGITVRPLSNAGENVASPAVPHTTATGGRSRSPPYPSQPGLVGLGAP